MQFFLRGLLLAGFVLSIAACGKSTEETLTVTGQVTFDGEPVPGVQVYFAPESGRGSHGLTANDGTFELYLTRDTKGVLPGLHRVTLEWAPEDEIIAGLGPVPIVSSAIDHIHQNGPVEVELKSSQSDLKIALP